MRKKFGSVQKSKNKKKKGLTIIKQTTKTAITIPMIKILVNPKEPMAAPLEFDEVNGMEVELVVDDA